MKITRVQLRTATFLSLLGLLTAGTVVEAVPPGPVTTRAQELINEGDRSKMQAVLQELTPKLGECQGAQVPRDYCSDLQQAESLLRQALDPD